MTPSTEVKVVTPSAQPESPLAKSTLNLWCKTTHADADELSWYLLRQTLFQKIDVDANAQEIVASSIAAKPGSRRPIKAARFPIEQLTEIRDRCLKYQEAFERGDSKPSLGGKYFNRNEVAVIALRVAAHLHALAHASADKTPALSQVLLAFEKDPELGPLSCGETRRAIRLMDSRLFAPTPDARALWISSSPHLLQSLLRVNRRGQYRGELLVDSIVGYLREHPKEKIRSADLSAALRVAKDIKEGVRLINPILTLLEAKGQVVRDKIEPSANKRKPVLVWAAV